MSSALGISSSASPAGLVTLGTQKKSKNVLDFLLITCYNVHYEEN